MQKAYNRKYWENKPSDKTPIDEQNLNHIEAGIDTIDGRVIALDTTKFDKTEAQGLFKDVALNPSNGVITFTLYNGSVKTIDTLLEKIAVNFDYDAVTQRLVITLDDGTVKYIDLSALITQYEFIDSDTIYFLIGKKDEVTVAKWDSSILNCGRVPNLIPVRYKNIIVDSDADISSITGNYQKEKYGEYFPIKFVTKKDKRIFVADFPDGMIAYSISVSTEEETSPENTKELRVYTYKSGSVSAEVKEGSIGEKHLRPDYLAEIKVESAKAEASRDAAEQSANEADYDAKLAQSYAVGGSGIREGEDTDNAKKYKELAEQAYENLQNSNVTSVNGQTGDVNLTAENVGALSLKTGGTVNNTFIVNKTSSTFPTNLKEIIVDSDGKVGFLGAVNGVNNTLLHLDRSSSTNSQITMKNATRLILPRNVEGPPSVTLNIKGAGGGIHLEHNAHGVAPNAGLWVTETGVTINSVYGDMDVSERNHNFTAASFNQSNHRIRLYTPDINIGPDGDFFIQAYFGNDSVSNSMYKNIKIRGALDSSISMFGVNEPKTVFGQRNGKFVFRNFDYSTRDANITETAGYSDTIAVLNEDGTLVLFTDYDNEDVSYDVKLSGYDGLIFGLSVSDRKIAYTDTGILRYNGYEYCNLFTIIDSDGIYRIEPLRSANVKTLNFGTSTNKWTNIYATNGTIQTSDRNEKNTIHDLTIEEAESLIYGASPKTYRMNSGTSNRTHWGLISQDVEEQLKELGWSSLDFAGFIKSPKEIIITEDENGKPLREPITQTIEGEYNYSLRYDEFIAPLIKTVQTQHEEIETLKQEMTLLKQQMQDLLNREV